MFIKSINPGFVNKPNFYGIGTPCLYIEFGYQNNGEEIDLQRLRSIVFRSHLKLVYIDILIHPYDEEFDEFLTLLSCDGYNILINTLNGQIIEDYRHIRNLHFTVELQGDNIDVDDIECLISFFHRLDKDDYLLIIIDDEVTYEKIKNEDINRLHCQIGVGTSCRNGEWLRSKHLSSRFEKPVLYYVPNLWEMVEPNSNFLK